MQSFQDIWEPVRKALGDKFSDTIMELWFNHLELAALSDTTAVLISDSDMKADIINKRYRSILAEKFEAAVGFPVEVVTLSSEHTEIDRDRLRRDVSMGLPVTPFFITGSASPAPEASAQDPAAEKDAAEKEKEPAAKDANAKDPATQQNAQETEANPDAKKKHYVLMDPNDKENYVPMYSSASTDDVKQERKMKDVIEEPFLNKEYTFENFIVGSSNKFAHAACVAVANNPAYAYNPLFIYGPSGLGKTHLLYAITNRIKELHPNACIQYVKGETFTNQLIESISTETTARFREKYRQADVFLIDDVQFIAGKVSTQEEFFNTFNELYEAKKQIILTSDRPPKEIKTLEDRVKTRFEWGLIADIQPPDLELRIAILKKKAEYMNVQIPIEVLNYLAEKLKSNIRQIEGAIKRLGAYSELTQQPITIDMARENIADVIQGTEPIRVTQDKIFKAVADKYGVTVEDIKGTRRTKNIAMARHVSIYILRTLTDMSLPAIGRVMGRDHSTILSSCDTVVAKMREDALVESDIDGLIKEISNS